MTNYMGRQIEMEEIEAWRYTTDKEVEVRVEGVWYAYSLGPTLEVEVKELVEAGKPQEPDDPNSESFKVSLEVPIEDAERLYWTANSGELEDLGITEAEYVDLESPDPDLMVE